MDVAAVRPDELEPEREPSGGGRRTAASRLRPVLLVMPAVALVALVVLAVLTALHLRNHARLADARDGALTAAKAEAVNLTTIRYTSAAADLDRILAGATGKLRAQFETERAQFPSLLARSKSTSTGRVLSAAVVSCSANDGTAQVVVASDADVSTATAGGQQSSALKHYRMVMQLTRVGGRWLVSDVAFAGVPQ